LHAEPDRSVGVTRFWAAKEAVAKARGTGLMGRPRDFEVFPGDGEQLTVVVDGTVHPTATELVHHGPGTYAVAWSRPADEGGPHGR
jgi:phosphopantetheinyl transferase